MIEFLCPNGHRIRCQAEQAGRAAKCPRCGVKFRVPEADRSGSVGGGRLGFRTFLRPEFTDSTGSSKKLPAAGGGERKGAPDRVPLSERASSARAGESSGQARASAPNAAPASESPPTKTFRPRKRPRTRDQSGPGRWPRGFGCRQARHGGPSHRPASRFLAEGARRRPSAGSAGSHGRTVCPTLGHAAEGRHGRASPPRRRNHRPASVPQEALPSRAARACSPSKRRTEACRWWRWPGTPWPGDPPRTQRIAQGTGRVSG